MGGLGCPTSKGQQERRSAPRQNRSDQHALVVRDGPGGVDDGGSAIAAVRRLAARLPKSPPPFFRGASTNGALQDSIVDLLLQWIDRQVN